MIARRILSIFLYKLQNGVRFVEGQQVGEARVLTPTDRLQQEGCHFHYLQTQVASLMFEDLPTSPPD